MKLQNKIKYLMKEKDGEKAKLSDQVTFDYSATIDDKKFEEVREKSPVRAWKKFISRWF